MSFTNPDSNVEQLRLEGTERVAVFGSGAGGHSFAIARAQKGNGRVYAIDVRDALVKKIEADARQMRISGVSGKVANFEKLGGTGLAPNSLDVVVIPNTLFSAEHKQAMLDEAFRICKAGAKLLIIDWIDSFGGMGPQPENIVPKESAKEMAEKAGFEIEHDFPAGSQHYGLLFRKTRPKRLVDRTAASAT